MRRIGTSVRNFVALAQSGLTAAEHETFFREMLGRVDTPTTPFGLIDVQGDGFLRRLQDLRDRMSAECLR